jgi:hypothetical protein
LKGLRFQKEFKSFEMLELVQKKMHKTKGISCTPNSFKDPNPNPIMKHKK